MTDSVGDADVGQGPLAHTAGLVLVDVELGSVAVQLRFSDVGAVSHSPSSVPNRPHRDFTQ